MAGRSALKLEIGYCVPWLAILFQNGKRTAGFPFASFRILIFYKETFHFSPRNLRIEDFADPNRRLADLWALAHTDSKMAMPFLPTANKVRGFSLSFQNGKCFERFPSVSFYILIFLSENCLQTFSASLSAVFSRHSLTQFSNLSFLSTCGPAKRVCPPPTSNFLPRTYLLCPSKTSYHKESILAVRGFYLLI